MVSVRFRFFHYNEKIIFNMKIIFGYSWCVRKRKLFIEWFCEVKIIFFFNSFDIYYKILFLQQIDKIHCQFQCVRAMLPTEYFKNSSLKNNCWYCTDPDKLNNNRGGLNVVELHRCFESINTLLKIATVFLIVKFLYKLLRRQLDIRKLLFMYP